MSSQFPHTLFIRLADEDKRRIQELSIKAEIPQSTLARIMLRQWMRANEPTGQQAICQHTSSET